MKKKLLFLSIIISSLLLFNACDYNESNFPGLDDLAQSKDITTYEYTVTDADISTIVKGLYANKDATDSAMAKYLNTNKVFSVSAPASVTIPYLLKSMYYGANKGTSANITYKYKTGTASYYALTSADYTSVWGNDIVKALTPTHSPNTVLPSLLNTKYPSVTEGDVRIAEYQYSAIEPTSTPTEMIGFLDDFEAYTAGSGIAVPNDNLYVINKDLIGTYFWQCRSYNNNKYAQATSNKSTTQNEIWMITKQIDLSATDNANFTFDVTVGYYNADCLTVLVSENFDGTESGIQTATWIDVTSNFTLPQEPASGYGTLGTAGIMDFSAYAGKKIYIAFKYTGDDSGTVKKTTTYQLDNIKVTYNKVVVTVPTTETRFAYYRYENGTWNLISKSFYQLTADDYTTMGVTRLSATTAPNYLPALLKLKYPFAQEGDSKIAVYQTSSTANNADEYIYKNGVWTPLSLVETRTDQFVFSGWDVNGWVFDPTLRVTMKKGLNPTDDYMMLVNYVKETYGTTYPTVLGYYGTSLQSEYYYGASGYYGNISLRESDRLKDPSYAALTTAEEKAAFLEARTQEGLAVYLALKFPDAQPQVSGIDVYAYVTTAIYDGTTTSTYIYKYQRMDNENLKWKYIESTKQ
ncbi:conserved exported hypothetical protein [uncultured Paludibacter sp.]|nr:conserved exported hypothetical protein [uncultured Paludibacter sp.]